MPQNYLYTSIKILLLTHTGFGVMLGLIRISRVPKIFGRILIVPIIIGMIYSLGLQYWRQLPGTHKTLVLMGLLPIVVVVSLRLILGRDLFREILGHLIYDLLKNGILGFSRIMGRIFLIPIYILRRLWE